MINYSINLVSYKDVSYIGLIENNRQVKSLTFSNPSHKYQAKDIYNSLKSELVTYGDGALLELFSYYLKKQQ